MTTRYVPPQARRGMTFPATMAMVRVAAAIHKTAHHLGTGKASAKAMAATQATTKNSRSTAPCVRAPTSHKMWGLSLISDLFAELLSMLTGAGAP
jgi:hypothetical protein